jgi:hypothetical protein
LDIRSFAFRYACYSEFHWTPGVVASLPEPEAARLAILFEEIGAYTYRENKKSEGKSGGDGYQAGLKPGFVEDFSFGEEDDTDYWHFKDDGVEIVD